MELLEIGKKISKANAARLRAAMETLQELMSQAMADGAEEASESIRPLVESLGKLAEADLTHDDIRSALRAALGSISGAAKRWYYIKDVAGDSSGWFVYDDEDTTAGTTRILKRSYVLVDGKVTLGEPLEVRQVTSYEPVSEAARLTEQDAELRASGQTEISGDFVPLMEKAVRRDGTVPIKVIEPGWGASGYYGPEVLERDGPKKITAGTHMYWNHPTATQEAERPERDLRDLAAVTVSDARWDPNGPSGPGLYADAKVFSGYKEAIDEMAPYIGVSIRGFGRSKTGEVEGKQGKIVEGISTIRSVDFVTRPGAGGQVLQLFEAARDRAGERPGGRTTSPREGEEMSDQELREAQRQLEEANRALAEERTRRERAEAAVLLTEARAHVAGKLAGSDLPDFVRDRLASALAANPPVSDGALDRGAYDARIEEAVKAEVEYLAKVTGSGQITGMGSGAAGAGTEQVEAKMQGAFQRLGLSESAAKTAAAGRR